jgi:hypothetical protein
MFCPSKLRSARAAPSGVVRANGITVVSLAETSKRSTLTATSNGARLTSAIPTAASCAASAEGRRCTPSHHCRRARLRNPNTRRTNNLTVVKLSAPSPAPATFATQSTSELIRRTENACTHSTNPLKTSPSSKAAANDVTTPQPRRRSAARTSNPSGIYSAMLASTSGQCACRTASDH